jgi:uncharacterized protein
MTPKTRSTLIILVFFALCALIAFSEAKPAPTQVEGSDTLSGGTTTIHIARALTNSEREQGLSGRPTLPDGEGMLFVFDHADSYAFWMPKMRFAIDIIDTEKRIVDIKRDATPESYPTLFRSRSPATYVLEVPSGFAAQSGWNIGMMLDFHTER